MAIFPTCISSLYVPLCSIREDTRQDVSEKTLVVQHKMSNCSQSGADLFADSRDGSVRRDSLRSVITTATTTRDEEREDECGSRVMPNMPTGRDLGPERGQGRFTEESRKLSPAAGLRHNPQTLANTKEEENEEQEKEEDEELPEDRQHIEHSVEARVVVQLDRSLG